MLNKLIVECSEYEFKEELEISKPRSWLKTVSAFSNSAGGSIFFGVMDDGSISGLSDVKLKISKISELIKSRIEPIPSFEIKTKSQNGKNIIEVKVHQGRSTPYYYHADGVTAAYIRNGDQSIEAPVHILNELILKGTGQTYDTIVTGMPIKDFSFSFLRSKYRNRTGFSLKDEDFVSFGLCKDDFITRAGLLLADENNLLQCRIFCTRWNGTNKISEKEVIDDQEISGSLIKQLDSAFDFYKRNTKSGWHKEKGETISDAEYDDEAIKEALVNAIVHRDYNVIGAEVCLNIYDDRIEVTSPGTMFSGVRLPEKIDFTMESVRRNPVIADLFGRMNLMNRRGSGLSNITEKTNALFNDGKNHVFYSERGCFFVVKIENSQYESIEKNTKESTDGSESLSKKEYEIMDELSKDSYQTYEILSTKIGISKRTVANAISSLIEKGFIKRVGPDKGGYWQIIKVVQ